MQHSELDMFVADVTITKISWHCCYFPRVPDLQGRLCEPSTWKWLRWALLYQ